MRTQRLEEGWVKFERTFCKEGYIDRWTGDSIDDPNKPQRHQLKLNSFHTYWRLNDGKWIGDIWSRDTEVYLMLKEFSETHTAQEIWESLDITPPKSSTY